MKFLEIESAQFRKGSPQSVERRSRAALRQVAKHRVALFDRRRLAGSPAGRRRLLKIGAAPTANRSIGDFQSSRHPDYGNRLPLRFVTDFRSAAAKGLLGAA